MLRWLARQYAKRIVNINANICIASSLAMLLTAGLVSISRHFGVNDGDKKTIMAITFIGDWFIDLVVAIGLHWLANHWPAQWRRSLAVIEKADEVLDSAPPPGLSVMKDAAAGALVPQVIAQHAGRVKGGEMSTRRGGKSVDMAGVEIVREPVNGQAGSEVSFVRDATTIQLQRLCLSPLFYAIAVVMQGWLLHYVEREWSVIIPFASAIIVTRVIHTYWMIKTDPVVLEEWEQARRRRNARGKLRARRQQQRVQAVSFNPDGVHAGVRSEEPGVERRAADAAGGV